MKRVKRAVSIKKIKKAKTISSTLVLTTWSRGRWCHPNFSFLFTDQRCVTFLLLLWRTSSQRWIQVIRFSIYYNWKVYFFTDVSLYHNLLNEMLIKTQCVSFFSLSQQIPQGIRLFGSMFLRVFLSIYFHNCHYFYCRLHKRVYLKKPLY
jgi:hypothetical protein